MTLIEQMVEVRPGASLAGVLAARAVILRLSQQAHDAVLLPAQAGGLSHTLRAVLAARVARQNAQTALAAHYDGLARSAEIDTGEALQAEQARVAAITAHSDLLTLRPRDATRHDIEVLKAAGVTEPDIVRVAELVAFVNYQARVIRGLQCLAQVQR